MAGKAPWKVKMGNYADGRLRKPDNIDSIHTDDKFIVSYSEKVRMFCGIGILYKKKRAGNTYILEFRKISGGKGFDEFEEPVEYYRFKDKLKWKPNKGSIRKLPQSDFETIVSNSWQEWDILKDTANKTERVMRAILRRKYGSQGEGREHKKIKKWVKNHPESIGLMNVVRAVVEHSFPSGDCVDILFVLPDKKYAVVEIETFDALPGAYQAVKYRALMCARCRIDLNSDNVQAILVAYRVRDDVKEFCSRYGIRCVETRCGEFRRKRKILLD